jgi:integrase
VDKPPKDPSEKKARKPKTELESKSFKDGAIYLFKRADYVKPTWFCRVKVPGAKGYISQSTKTTDEHAAYKFADDLFHKALVSHGEKRTIYSLRHTYATFRLQEGVHQFVLAKNMGTSVAMLEKHYGHTSNVASAAELTKGGTFKGDKKTKSVDWLME